MELLIGYLKAFPLEMGGVRWVRARTQWGVGGRSKRRRAYVKGRRVKCLPCWCIRTD